MWKHARRVLCLRLQEAGHWLRPRSPRAPCPRPGAPTAGCFEAGGQARGCRQSRRKSSGSGWTQGGCGSVRAQVRVEVHGRSQSFSGAGSPLSRPSREPSRLPGCFLAVAGLRLHLLAPLAPRVLRSRGFCPIRQLLGLCSVGLGVSQRGLLVFIFFPRADFR